MNDEQQKTSFDELVAGISSEERKYLLAKINQNRNDSLPLLQPLREEKEDFTLDIKLRSESIIYKFFLWIRSLLSKKQKIELYNDDLVSSLARKINKNHPGIVDMSNSLLLPLFFEKLKELKASADFFKPYFATVADNPGKFYVFMSTFIAPDIASTINENADPYSESFENEGTKELRANLLKKLESILKDISSQDKAVMYDAVKSLNWLKRFTEIPYTHFLAQFTAIISDDYTCPFTNAQADFPALSGVLTDSHSIPTEALESLFLFPQRNGENILNVEGDTEKSMRDFLSKSATNISMIQMFISTVPLSSLGKVIFNDYDWQLENYGGAEDWFVKFKEEWKVVFDERWELWIRDRKKYQLAGILKEKFGILEFPELPYRPWSKLWGGITFRCEMTGGFLYWFASEKYDEVIAVLNVLALEGVFLNNDNRSEYSEALNRFAEINHQVLSFGTSLSEKGAVGSVFEKLISEHVRTMKGQNMVNSMMLNAETSVRNWERGFCECARSIENVLHGILDDEKDDKKYESIQNLMTIRGRENRAYRDSLQEKREMILECRNILAEIEPLDLPKVEKKK